MVSAARGAAAGGGGGGAIYEKLRVGIIPEPGAPRARTTGGFDWILLARIKAIFRLQRRCTAADGASSAGAAGARTRPGRRPAHGLKVRGRIPATPREGRAAGL
eukprot:SAG31_NODE_716_length_12626_cov_7.493973_2_plen_104_part_00